jgi:hypothetical protein
MVHSTLETQIKLFISNNFLVTITTIVLLSDNTRNIPIIKGFQNPHLAFYLQQIYNLN